MVVRRHSYLVNTNQTVCDQHFYTNKEKVQKGEEMDIRPQSSSFNNMNQQ